MLTFKEMQTRGQLLYDSAEHTEEKCRLLRGNPAVNIMGYRDMDKPSKTLPSKPSEKQRVDGQRGCKMVTRLRTA